MIQTEYKGFTIEFNEDAEKWSIAGDSGRYSDSSGTLKSRKQYIDNLRCKGFERFECYLVSWGRDEPEKVTVTSITEDGEFAWIIRANGRREKCEIRNLFEISDTNNIRFDSIKKIDTEIDKLNTKIGEINSRMVNIKVITE